MKAAAAVLAVVALSGCLPASLGGVTGDTVDTIAEAGDARTAAALRGPCAATLGGYERLRLADEGLADATRAYTPVACVDRDQRLTGAAPSAPPQAEAVELVEPEPEQAAPEPEQAAPEPVADALDAEERQRILEAAAAQREAAAQAEALTAVMEQLGRQLGVTPEPLP